MSSNKDQVISKALHDQADDVATLARGQRRAADILHEGAHNLELVGDKMEETARAIDALAADGKSKAPVPPTRAR